MQIINYVLRQQFIIPMPHHGVTELILLVGDVEEVCIILSSDEPVVIDIMRLDVTLEAVHGGARKPHF